MKTKHKVIRISVLIAVVAIFGVMFGSQQNEISQSALTSASETFGISEQEILDNAQTRLVIQSFLDESPDMVIDEIEYSFKEIDLVNVEVKTMELIRTFTFDDNSQDIKNISSGVLDSVSLDFLAVKDDSRPLTNGKIKFDLKVPITKEVSIIEGQFSVGLGDNVIKTIVINMDNSDVVNGKITLLSNEFQMNQILSNLPDGVHTLEVRLDKLFIVYEDFSREYSNPLSVIYSVDFEKSSAQTIKKNEQGHFTKTFDFDVPITVSANQQSASVQVCLSGCRGGGCCITYSQGGVIPAPALGLVTVTDISTGEVVASKPPMGAGYCTGQGFGYTVLSGSLTQCSSSSGGGGSLGFSAQRGESYRVTVSDPSASWVIDVPESGGAYNYSCVDARSATQTGTSYGNYGTSAGIYSISSVRSCNFP